MRSNTEEFQAILRTPFARLGVRVDDDRVAEIVFLPSDGPTLAPQSRLAERACGQIERYVRDAQYRFDLPIEPQGTAFQRRVWRKITTIGAGRTRSYGEIARELDSSPRAVGQACGANPLPLVVPCHRVLAAAGIGGFAHHSRGFPLSVKRWLLAHEGVTAE